MAGQPLIKVNDGFGRGDERRAYAEFWADMHPHVVRVVEASFLDEATGTNLTPTQAEVKRRVDLCKDAVDSMRRDLGWSRQRIKDNLAHVLRARVAGITLDLDGLARRSSW